MADDLRKRFSRLSDDELSDVLEAPAGEYTEEALVAARAERARRDSEPIQPAAKPDEPLLPSEQADVAGPGAVGRLASFDLGRLTWAGWVVFLVSAPAVVGPLLLVDATLPELAKEPWLRMFSSLVGFALAVAIFFVLRSALGLLGIKALREKPTKAQTAGD